MKETKIEATYLTQIKYNYIHRISSDCSIYRSVFRGYCSDLAVNRKHQEQAISVELGNDSFNWILCPRCAEHAKEIVLVVLIQFFMLA